MFVVCCTEQTNTGEGPGQRIAGIVSATLRWWWEDFLIDWKGLDKAWTIHRVP